MLRIGSLSKTIGLYDGSALPFKCDLDSFLTNWKRKIVLWVEEHFDSFEPSVPVRLKNVARISLKILQSRKMILSLRDGMQYRFGQQPVEIKICQS